MARSLDVITTEIKVKVRTYPSLDVFLFPEDGGSAVSAFNCIIFVVAAAIYTFEIMMDILKSDIQAIADSAPSGNKQWLRAQILKFQYGDVVVLDSNFRPYYPVIDETKQIITQCSVQDTSGAVSIKVAKGISPVLTPLSGPELSALTDYYFGTSTSEGIGFAGISAAFVNQDPDRIRIEATIYFYGQYTQATVSTNVIAAIQTFLSQFQSTSFDGTIFMIRLVDAIQAVAGVSRVYLTSIKAREFSVPLGSATVVDIQGYYNTVAGYVITEDTSGNTITDTLTFTQEPATI
jgi:hypothetical protein